MVMTLEQAAEVAQQNTQRQRNLQDYIKFNAMQPAMESAADLQNAQNQLALQGAGQAAATQSAQQQLAEAQSKAALPDVGLMEAAKAYTANMTPAQLQAKIGALGATTQHLKSLTLAAKLMSRMPASQKAEMITRLQSQFPGLSRQEIMVKLSQGAGTTLDSSGSGSSPNQLPTLTQMHPGLGSGNPGTQVPATQVAGGATSTAQQANNSGLGGATSTAQQANNSGLGATAQSLHSSTANQTPMVQTSATTGAPTTDPGQQPFQTDLTDNQLNGLQITRDQANTMRLTAQAVHNNTDYNEMRIQADRVKNYATNYKKAYNNTLNGQLFGNTLGRVRDTLGSGTINKFLGKMGQTRALWDGLTNSTDPDYLAYKKFTQTQVPMLVDQLRNYWGTSITNDQIEKLNSMVVGNPFVNSPKQAFTTLNELITNMGGEQDTNMGNMPGYKQMMLAHGSDTIKNIIKNAYKPIGPQSTWTDLQIQKYGPKSQTGATAQTAGSATKKVLTMDDLDRISGAK